MVKCNRCGAIHKDWEISLSTRSERHGEVDTRQYESYLVCPDCGSANLEDFDPAFEDDSDLDDPDSDPASEEDE